MENNLEHSVQSLTENLQKDLGRSLPDLVDFSRKFAVNRTLKREAIMMSAAFQTGTESQEVLLQNALSLVRNIQTDYLQNHDTLEYKRQLEQKQKVIQHFKKITPSNEVIFNSKQLTKNFGSSNFTLGPINISLRLGEITGVVGENGNGKTTLFRILAGQLRKNSGDIYYPLFDEQDKKDWRAIKSKIAYVPQELESWYGTLKNALHYEAALHGIKGRKNDEDVEYIIYRLGLADHIEKNWNELSGGYKLRFALARALVWGPQLLILDEPLANLDIKSQAVVLTDLRELAKSLKEPISIILSSQHLHEVESIADKILLLKEGKEVFYGNRSDIGGERAVNYYELECFATHQELQKALAVTEGNIEIIQNRNQYIIKTSLDIDSIKLLNCLLKAKIDIIYFRNISQSIKSVFV